MTQIGRGSGRTGFGFARVRCRRGLNQPITRDGLKDIFGKEISRDLIERLHVRGLIDMGPRSPRRGAPYTFVTTEKFLVAFDSENLRDLPDREQLDDAGVSSIDD